MTTNALIKPVCIGKLAVVSAAPLGKPGCYRLQWQGHTIRVGLVVRDVVEGRAGISPFGQICIYQWRQLFPRASLQMSAFGQRSDVRLREALIAILNAVIADPDRPILILIAKNHSIYNKLILLIGVQ